ncbi:MAG: tetratricopeptide repeat protein, partial [Crocinitomicaceae bacterium]
MSMFNRKTIQIFSGNNRRIECTRLLLFVFLFTGNLHAQTREIDSLKRLVLTPNVKRDTSLFNTYIELSKATLKRDLEQTKVYTLQAQELADELNYAQGNGEVEYAKGKIALSTSNFVSARDRFFKALEIFRENKIRKKYAACYTAIGLTYQNTGDLDKAMSYFEKSLEYGKKYDPSSNSLTYMNMGTIYAYRSNFDQSLVYFHKAQELLQTQGKVDGLSTCYNNIGCIFD